MFISRRGLNASKKKKKKKKKEKKRKEKTCSAELSQHKLFERVYSCYGREATFIDYFLYLNVVIVLVWRTEPLHYYPVNKQRLKDELSPFGRSYS